MALRSRNSFKGKIDIHDFQSIQYLYIKKYQVKKINDNEKFGHKWI